MKDGVGDQQLTATSTRTFPVEVHAGTAETYYHDRVKSFPVEIDTYIAGDDVTTETYYYGRQTYPVEVGPDVSR